MLHDRVSGLGDATNSLFLGSLSISVQCGAGALSGGFNQMRETQTLAFIIVCICLCVPFQRLVVGYGFLNQPNWLRLLSQS